MAATTSIAGLLSLLLPLVAGQTGCQICSAPGGDCSKAYKGGPGIACGEVAGNSFCCPSRNSFLSGRRPSKTKVWTFKDHFREPGVGEDWVSFPGYFKQHGYTTLGGGKTYHPKLPPDNDGAKSWSTGDGVPGYVSHGDKGSCSTMHFDRSKKSKACPDDSANLG